VDTAGAAGLKQTNHVVDRDRVFSVEGASPEIRSLAEAQLVALSDMLIQPTVVEALEPEAGGPHWGTPVSHDYATPFPFTGQLNKGRAGSEEGMRSLRHRGRPASTLQG
jgi:hypothetical protein